MADGNAAAESYVVAVSLFAAISTLTMGIPVSLFPPATAWNKIATCHSGDLIFLLTLGITGGFIVNNGKYLFRYILF